MNISNVFIKEPCHESWDAMEDLGSRRFCDSCLKEVHDLSNLTLEQAQEVLSHEHVCIRYAYTEDDEHILFKDELDPVWRLYKQGEGVRALIAAASFAVPLLFTACDAPHPDPGRETSHAISPITLEEEKASMVHITPIEVGSARKTQMTKAQNKHAIQVEMGEPPMIKAHEKVEHVSCEDDAKKPHIKNVVRAKGAHQALPKHTTTPIRKTQGKPMRIKHRNLSHE